jgi:hypothetical protein
MIYLALWIVPALIVCVTLSFIFGTIVGALVSTFEKLWIKVKNPDRPAMTRVWGGEPPPFSHTHTLVFPRDRAGVPH